MRGVHRLRVRSAHIACDMAFQRNVTVIQGDSATGKTTLVDMIRVRQLNGADTGITLTCDVPCRVLEGSGWQETLSRIEFHAWIEGWYGLRSVAHRDLKHAGH